MLRLLGTGIHSMAFVFFLFRSPESAPFFVIFSEIILHYDVSVTKRLKSCTVNKFRLNRVDPKNV